LAEIVTVVETFCDFVDTVKVAEVAPAATVTLAGTVAAEVFDEDNETTMPPAGAAEDNTTLPVLRPSPFTVDGVRVKLVKPGDGGAGVTVKEPCEKPPFDVAVTVDVVEVATAVVLAVNVALN